MGRKDWWLVETIGAAKKHLEVKMCSIKTARFVKRGYVIMNSIYENVESNVRSYCRKYPISFDGAYGSKLYAGGVEYIDFLAVAGSMNYGHNNPYIKKAIMNYLGENRPINLLDMYTPAKEEFLFTFKTEILMPRNLDYKIMCCGPTGTNGVEAAIKLSRKNTKRTEIIAFSGAFHGMTLGSLALTTDRMSREGSGVLLNHVTHIPYDGNGAVDSIEYLRWLLEDDHSGVDKPAAIILETVQAEGGVNIASVKWLRAVRDICDAYDILLIVDDIQVGNGRTGEFFSFERAGIVPDMVVLSKSISGFGLPMTLLLIRPDLDIFRPAEHNGTFRGNQLGFVGGTAAVKYFNKYNVSAEVKRKEFIVREYMDEYISRIDTRIKCRGIGLLWGIDLCNIDPGMSRIIMKKAFENRLIIELAGRHDSVIKIMPPLVIEDEVLIEGLEILRKVVQNEI